MIENMHYPQGESHGEQSIAVIVRDHQGKLLKYIRRRIVSRQDAEDVAAQVMCEFLESCRRRPEIRHYVPLLFTIARFRVTDYFATHADRHREVPLDAVPEVPAIGSLQHDTETQMELTGVHRALDAMREEDREIITLHAIAGLTSGEIAEVAGTSPGAVRVRLFQARRKLKRKLREQGAEQSSYGDAVDQSED